MSTKTRSDRQIVGATCHSAPARRAQEKRLGDVLTRGVWKENPVLVQALGLCPALAVTNTVVNSIAMGLATFVVLTASSVMVSSLKRLIPTEVRITAWVLIIATFVTVVDLYMAATVPDVQKALGPFIFLIVVNCIILGRQEAFSSRQPVLASFVDAVGTGFGFILALLIMGTIRELMGSGTLLGIPLFGPRFQPWVVMALPPGGFFTIGGVLLAMNAWQRRRDTATREHPLRRWPHEILGREPEQAA